MTNSTLSASSILLLEWWKPIEGYDGVYEVSNVGNVCRVVDREGRTSYRHLKKAIAKRTGYYKLDLNLRGATATKNVHQLVAAAFLGPAPNGYTVNHINPWKLNNKVSNLEYLTRGDNVRHAYQHNLGPIGSRHHNSILTEAKVVQIKKLMGQMTHKQIGELFGVSKECFDSISTGRNWARVP